MKSFVITMSLFVVAFIGVAIYIFMTRQPEMYLTEITCLQVEKLDSMSLVGVGPNPLKWSLGSERCIEYSEPTMRINPAYLEWVERENH